MPTWKQLLLSLYYYGTYPMRMHRWRREALRGHWPVVVFCYHRVADDRANAWTTSTRMFVRQIEWLTDRFRFISLEEAQRRIRAGHNSEPCVSITFDDGYADNCREAIPLLVRRRIPCTYFVTLRNLLDGTSFSHDRAMGNHLSPNTLAQLQEMAAEGVEIGAHAYSHVDLGAIHNRRLLQREVVAAGEELATAIGRPVRYFAFPFGLHANLNAEAFALARRSGYLGVCSAYGGFNFPGDDAFHLQRVTVDDNMIGLKNWATLDPRKLRIPRFRYRHVRWEETPKERDAAEPVQQG